MASGEMSEMGQDIWAVGADLSPFSRTDLRIKWHEIEHRPGSPQRRAALPRRREWKGAGVGGVASHAQLLLSADGGE